jgi:uncharacterized membrane protein
MTLRTPLIVSVLAIAAMLAISGWGWNALPAHAQMATHWGLSGRPNGYMPKEIGLFLPPAVAVMLVLLFSVLPKIEPRRNNLLASRKLYFASWYGALGVLTVIHLMVVLNAAGVRVDINRWVLVTMSLLFVLLGNYMGKSRSTFFVGTRLPWTLTSELAWNMANRLVGYGFVATGLAVLLTLAVVGSTAAIIVCVFGLTVTVVVGVVAAFVYWKRDANRSNGDSLHE